MRRLLILFIILLSVGVNAQVGRYPVSNTSHLGAAVANMLTDGTFDQGTTYWTPETGAWTVSGGTASYDDTGTSALAQSDGDMQSSILANTDYIVTFTVSGLSAGTANIRLENSDGSVQYTSSIGYANGTHNVPITTPGSVSPAGLRYRASITSGSAFNLDNVSVIPD
jgi:hypothetical protein